MLEASKSHPKIKSPKIAAKILDRNKGFLLERNATARIPIAEYSNPRANRVGTLVK
jgi:hypothetical protein